jgi:hypothetical protein
LVFVTGVSGQFLRAICKIKTACSWGKKALQPFLNLEAKKKQADPVAKYKKKG